MTNYRATTWLPPLVQQAVELARTLNFENSSRLEVGHLLCTLAASVRSGVVAEIGSGIGVGSAWIVSALSPGVRFVTVEIDSERAAAVRQLLSSCSNAQVLEGDWRIVLESAPFSLLFADAKAAKQYEPETLLNSLQIGGMMVLDDLTPEHLWPPEWLGRPDPVRDFWLNDPRVVATELLVTSTSAIILATRLP